MTPFELARLHAAGGWGRPWSEGEFRRLLESPGTFGVSEVSGFALGRAAADEVELLTIAVVPEARRQGAGRRLVAAFEAEAARRGAQRSFLEVSEDNRPARALYAACGYAECGRRTGYYARPEGACDAILLEKSLLSG